MVSRRRQQARSVHGPGARRPRRGDLGLMVYIGDKLGLYKAMAGAGPVTPAELAARTATDERYVREWLDNQAAGGYVRLRRRRRTYELSPEQALALADEDSPAFLPGGFTASSPPTSTADKFVDAFRTGRGVGWHEHDARLFLGTERFFRPGYKGYLVSDGSRARRGRAAAAAGATVADVGCGHGASTILMAHAYPASRFVGFDYHDGLDRHRPEARRRSRRRRPGALRGGVGQGLPAGRLRPRHASSTASTTWATRWGPPCTFAGRSPTAAPSCSSSRTPATVRRTIQPVGRAFYGFSTVVCTMASLAQEVGLALGAQAGEARLREVFEQAGFSAFRRATETPMNIVFEAQV